MRPRNTTSILSRDEALHLLRETRENAKNSSLEKPYICGVCNKAYPLSNSLYRHIHRTHMVNQFKCGAPGCLQTFGYKTELEQHRLIHSSDRQYPCTDCSSSFKYPANLTRHKRTHHPERAAGRHRIQQEQSAGASRAGEQYVHLPPAQIRRSAADSTTPNTGKPLAAAQEARPSDREENHLAFPVPPRRQHLAFPPTAWSASPASAFAVRRPVPRWACTATYEGASLGEAPYWGTAQQNAEGHHDLAHWSPVALPPRPPLADNTDLQERPDPAPEPENNTSPWRPWSTLWRPW